jgi:Phage integrase family
MPGLTVQEDPEHGGIGRVPVLAFPGVSGGPWIDRVKSNTIVDGVVVVVLLPALTDRLPDSAPDLAPRDLDVRLIAHDRAVVGVAFLKRRRKAQAKQMMRVRDVWSDYDVVLSDEIGLPLMPWSVSADLRRLTKALELPRTRFHDLRHAHATQLLAAGVHPKAVSERLGHSSTAFTMDTYSAVIPSMGRAAADTADQLFGEERGR